MGILDTVLGGVGAIAGSILNKSAAKKQYNQQVSFAQNAIQWKAADAIKAGLHPLAALGANTVSYSPQAVGDMAGPLSDMGQNVGRAIEATKNGTERMSGALGNLQLERAGLENDLLRTQIASQQAQLRAQVGPPMPTDGGVSQAIPGQGNSITLAGQHKVDLPPGVTLESGQINEDALGDSGGEVLNAWNTWKTAKHNPRTIARLAAELGYSLTPYGLIKQNMPTQVPAWFKKAWTMKKGKGMYGYKPERRYD